MGGVGFLHPMENPGGNLDSYKSEKKGAKPGMESHASGTGPRTNDRNYWTTPFQKSIFQNFMCLYFQWSTLTFQNWIHFHVFIWFYKTFACVHYTHLDLSRLMFHVQECKFLPVCGITTLWNKNQMETWNSFHEYSIDSIKRMDLT